MLLQPSPIPAIAHIRETAEQPYKLSQVCSPHRRGGATTKASRTPLIMISRATHSGRTLADLDLRPPTSPSPRCGGAGVGPLAPMATPIEEGDVVVLLGVEESLAAAEMKLMQG